MKCGIGDKVRFLNDVGGGIVTKIIDKRTVAVQTEDGFEIPALDLELVIIGQGDEKLLSIIPDKESSGTMMISKKSVAIASPQIKKNSEPIAKNEASDPQGNLVGLYLAFVPDASSKVNGTNQNLYIINDSDYRVFFSLSVWNQQNVTPLKSGLLLPDSKEFIKSYASNELNNHFMINVQSLFFKNTPFTIQQPEYSDININPTKLYKEGSFIENDFFEENAYIISIADSQKEELLRQITNESIKESISYKDSKQKPQVRKVIKPDIEEVDLHIHELVENHQSLSSGEIIKTQLARFETVLEGGIRDNSTKKIVFIHGLGNGKLKFEIKKILDTKYSKLKYQDASFQEYGYGATLVYIR